MLCQTNYSRVRYVVFSVVEPGFCTLFDMSLSQLSTVRGYRNQHIKLPDQTCATTPKPSRGVKFLLRSECVLTLQVFRAAVIA